MKRVSTTVFSLCALILMVGLSPAVAQTKPANGFEKMSEAQVLKLRNTGNLKGENAKNLEIKIKIDAEAEKDNATRSNQFETQFDVRVSRDGRTVRDAKVTVHAYNGPTKTLKFDDDEYEGEVKGYHRAYRVDVVAGDQRVEGIYLAGPAIPTFTSHKNKARVPAKSDLKLAWKADDAGADRVRIKGEEFDWVEVGKDTSYTVAASKLDDDDDEFEIKRANVMKLPQLAGNSSFAIEVENTLELKVKR